MHATPRRLVLLATLAVLSLAGHARAADEAAGDAFLWIEGEAAARCQVHRNAWFDNVSKPELSAGDQIASFAEPNQPHAWAEYDITVPRDGTYHFWLRANPCTGIAYRVDGGAEVALDAKAMQAEDKKNRRNKAYVRQVYQRWNTAPDGTADARYMTWYRMGTLDLAKGKHTLRFSLGGRTDEKRFAAIDCFVLATGAFTPHMHYKPGEEPTDLVAFPADDSWAFDPEADAFATDAVLDLRYLNEKTAGEHGFIRLSPDGEGFVRGDGQPIRFWGGSTYVQRDAHKANDQGILEHHARFLAKRGVNVVRLHGSILPKTPGAKITDVTEEELDQIYRLVAAMKKAGIYTIISPYWGSHAKPLDGWDVADSGAGSLTGLLFFEPELQRGYKAWLKRIYADTNPHTGVPLAKDPAVAIIQIQNEDSMLFYTMQRVKGAARQMLCKRYGDWVKRKYGSFDKARKAWDGYAHPDDDFGAGLPGMFIVWEFTQDARNQKGTAAGREARLADQCEFMTRTMHAFNTEIARYLRDDLGCKHLINAGNWRTADQTVLDDAERWSYTANEVVAKNHYFGGLHNGINRGWQILPGQVFTNRSFTREPMGSPLAVRQVVGHPFCITESLWVPPGRWQCEGPLIVAAQCCLTGQDTFYWFATGEPEWARPMNKWTFAVPTLQGQFPAAALIYRKGYVDAGPAVVHEERRLTDVWRRRLPLIAEGGAWDPNRDKGEMPPGTPQQAPVDPLAHLVGRVEVTYDGDPARSKVIDLDPYIDHEKQVVRSVTGQMQTDIARGVYRVSAPRAQGAAGFLGAAGPQKLADVTLDCRNAYASVVVVPLDEKPIAASRRLLVQVGTVCRPTGWTIRPLDVPRGEATVRGARIVSVGERPWRVEKTQATVRIRNKGLSKATALDANGMSAGDVTARRDGDALIVTLPPDALYVCVE